MVDFHDRDDSADSGLPPRLVEGLKALYGAAGPVPESVDRAVSAAARHGLRRRPAWSLRRSWIGAAAAIAACLGIAVWLGESSRRVEQSVPLAAVPRLREDLNGDGHVDVLDAFLLARHVERRDTLKPSWDIDGDGRVDRRDVDRVAAAAVSLQREPAS